MCRVRFCFWAVTVSVGLGICLGWSNGERGTVASQVEPSSTRTPTGHCYEHSFQLITLINSDMPQGAVYRKLLGDAGLKPGEALLVHGTVEHAIDRAPMDHAWVEIGGYAIDVTTSLDAPDYMGPRQRYYQLGKMRDADCRRYTLAEATRLADEHGHLGPWTSGAGPSSFRAP